MFDMSPSEMAAESNLVLHIDEVLALVKEMFPDKEWKVRVKLGKNSAVQFYDYYSCFRFNITEPCKFSFNAEYDNLDLGIDLKDLGTSTIKEKLIEVKQSL